MTLDSWLVARLARELEERLRGARVQAVVSSETQLTLHCYRRGASHALRCTLEQSNPLVAAYAQEAEPKEKGAVGWAAAVAALLRGCIVDAIHAVPNDRVMFVDLSSRSAFGLPSMTRVVLELQPRKANLLVLRGGNDDVWVIVAAAKQFTAPSASLEAALMEPARDVSVGSPYILPPGRRSALDRAQFLVQVAKTRADASASAQTQRAALARLLGLYDPACTPPLAREVVHRVHASDAGGEASTPNATAGRDLLGTWQQLREALGAAEEQEGPLYAYESGAKLVALHLVPLQWPGVVARREASLNDVCAAEMRQPRSAGDREADALRKRLATMLARCATEAAALRRAAEKASEADVLRHAGELIFSNLADIPEGAAELIAGTQRVPLDAGRSAKENAAQYFKRYKKARSGLPQIQARLGTLEANREYWEQLSWELQRLPELPAPERQAVIAELTAAIGGKRRASAAPAKGKQPDRKIALSDGAIAYVGRSPKDNERLTFRVASGNDYWFHARGIPGAHVIVKTNGSAITDVQIREAAELAAGHSRAATAGAADVDYTQRKHVRRHSSGRPGLVWYDNFKTTRVTLPRS
ncbi:MAG: NFACT RNA binding domain-containing protein [Candidatus Eremiobacteraeota bacterium]|nr:NFACT RNA binding domain-containing protein [Candidatus Eremiobacteraeota bacterium]